MRIVVYFFYISPRNRNSISRRDRRTGGIRVKRKKIAVLMASIDREYQTDFIRGVMDTAEELNIDVCVFNCMGYMNVDVATSDRGESAVFDLAGARDFDGIISLRATLAGESSVRKVEKLLHRMAGLPHVSIDVPTNGAVSIQFDDAVSVRQVTEHVITRHGARNIVYLSGPLRQMVAMNRLQACRETMEAHGLTLAPENIFEGEWVQGSGRQCAEELLRRPGGLPDAILCGNDDMAFGVTDCLMEKGYQVPQDVIVTGYDALREAVARGLTTIRRPIDQAARIAVETLSGWMAGETPKEYDIVLPGVPIYGASCGCFHETERNSPSARHGMRGGHRRMESVLLISMFSGSLVSVVNEEDAREKIDQFVQTMGIGELYLCVDPSVSRPGEVREGNDTYPNEMLLLYGFRDGERMPAGRFPLSRILPVLDEERERPVKLVFCPLYYRERNFGYVALRMGTATGVALYSVLMLFNGALMSLYLQNSLREYARKVEDMSVHDIMTGMLNRRGFQERYRQVLDRARREGSWFVLLSADMDHMKQINDRYGHLTGDQAIGRMGRAMEKLRKGGMEPVHISGDEFLAFGIRPTLAEAERVLSEAREAVRQLNEEEPWMEETSASFGLYTAVPTAKDTIDLFLTRADHAMYEEKKRKKAAARQAESGK